MSAYGVQPTRRRGWLLTGAVAVVVIAAGVVENTTGSSAPGLSTQLLVSVALIGLAVLIAYPLPLFGLVAVVGAVGLPLVWPGSHLGGGGTQLITLMVLIAYAAFRLPRWVSLVAYLVSAVATAIGAVLVGNEIWELAFYLLVLGPAWAIGMLLQRERSRSAELSRLAAELAAERELRTRVALAAERTRIAQELHDAVAHSVSVMTMQVGVVRRRLAPGSVEQDTLLGAERLGRQSVDELRRIVGLVRPADDDALAPLPTLRNLGDLVEQVRATGTAVTLAQAGEAAELAPALDMSVYRVVQEALTNALRHAPGSAIAIRIAHEPDRLQVSVTNTGGSAGHRRVRGGNGLTGMRERVRMFGGTLRTEPTADGGFEVAATFPLDQHAGSLV